MKALFKHLLLPLHKTIPAIKPEGVAPANGTELQECKLLAGGSTSPLVHEAKGRQFVAIAATGGGKVGTPKGDAYVAFALPKK